MGQLRTYTMGNKVNANLSRQEYTINAYTISTPTNPVQYTESP